jgi:hypothetical protein
MTDPAEAAILTLLAARGPEKSICPTEAARALAGHPTDDSWRPYLHQVRLAAARLQKTGKLDILRKGKPIPPEAAHGVIRLRAKP